MSEKTEPTITITVLITDDETGRVIGQMVERPQDGDYGAAVKAALVEAGRMLDEMDGGKA